MEIRPEHGRLRVAYFAGTMRPGHDGVTRVLYRLIDALTETGIESIFFSPIIPPRAGQQVPMYEVPSVKFPLYKDYRFAIPGQKHFEARLAAFDPDVIHINSPCPLGHAAVRYGRRAGIPVVATYHTHFPSYAKYYKIKALETFSWTYMRNLYNDCDRVYVPSEPIRKELRSHGFATTEFLPHGVDTGMFNPVYRSEEWRAAHGCRDKTVLLFAGRLVWEKDLRTLAEAYRIVTARRSDALFVLAGDGPVRGELTAMMPGALFLGQIGGTELSAAYASSDLFVFPSTTETFGNVTLESMASGVPPVCAREGGASGFVKSGATGLLAEPRNGADLADKIMFMLDHPEERKRMGEAALAFASGQSWERIFDRLFAGYVDLASAGRARRRKAA
ncbi:MAG TPA: glycosyltransferase family 1 protein [Bacteroidota bacterium]|nr:glycosyltransferase family 1 protein [Bacteroidota bacterium]